MRLKLKRYATAIAERFEALLAPATCTAEQAKLIKKFNRGFSSLASLTLYMNQGMPDTDVEDWMKATPFIYQERIMMVLSLLEEAKFWTRKAIIHKEDSALLGDSLGYIHVENLSDSVIHSAFVGVCSQLHKYCPKNLYLKFALMRLCRAYIIALESVEIAHNVFHCDRIDYLKRISRDF